MGVPGAACGGADSGAGLVWPMIDAFTTRSVYVPQPMHDKPQPAPDHEFRLPGHRLLSICGRDAIAFAQAQFMNDVATLADRHWQWNGWLTAKGRVVALFALLRLDAETLWLLLPDADPVELAAQLQRYVFRSKLKLLPLDLQVIGGFLPPPSARGPALAVSAAGDVELDMGAAGGPRSLQIRQAAATDDATACQRWDAYDLAHGLPRLTASQAGQWTPQQLSLERLRAFSVSKGCYPGQEIVARTHFLGQAKRGLGLFESEAPLPVGSEVSEDGRGIGNIVASAGNLSLAVLPLEHSDAGIVAAGAALQRRPLADGLAR